MTFQFYIFRKFFHPDPSVKRQSGFLTPQLNNSQILGSSLTIPYFYAQSENKDFTFTPHYLTMIFKCFKQNIEK